MNALLLCLALLLLHVVAAVLIGPSKLARWRKYKSGTGWCFWRWTDVDSEYILRLHVVKTPWFAVCLHWINKPDAEPWLHDHPVSFLSLILRGGYTELRRYEDGAPQHVRHNWYNIVRASDEDRHRITEVHGKTVTLCFMGPKTREWGFHVWTEVEPSGWIMWKRYYERLRAGEDMRRRLNLANLTKILECRYTPARVEHTSGLHTPLGSFVDVEKRRIDIAHPAVGPDDFDEEADTAPYGVNAFGQGPYGGR